VPPPGLAAAGMSSLMDALTCGSAGSPMAGTPTGDGSGVQVDAGAGAGAGLAAVSAPDMHMHMDRDRPPEEHDAPMGASGGFKRQRTAD
jgi:hypothetical protein